MRDDDDYEDDDRYDDRPPPFPATVMIAGIVWIGAGALSIINAVLTIAQAGGNQPGANPGGGFCAAAIGVAFLVCGYQTVTGKASDTRGNAIGSILLGTLQVLIGLALAVFGVGVGAAAANPNAGGPNPPPAAVAGIMVVIGGVVAVVGVKMITAGVLALVGRRQYLDWKRANDPAPRRRSGRRRVRDEDEEEEDDDDRPRRRRSRDDGDD